MILSILGIVFMLNLFNMNICLNLSPAINYDISFIDNNSGSEVFTLEGKGCQKWVVEEFRKAILGVSK